MSGTMRAVVAELTVARYLATAAGSRLRADVGWRRGGLLRLVDDEPLPPLPGADWVRLRPELSGICGSDVGLAGGRIALTLSAFYTARRQIPGHEVVAVVDTVGPAVTRVVAGDRVALDPIVACRHRGFTPVCASCARGRPQTCNRFAEAGTSGCLAPSQGFDAVLGGGLGQVLVAHEEQCRPVGDLPSRRAVLVEPAGVALQAARRWERDGDHVVVIGPGTIGSLVVASLRRLHPDLSITAVAPDALGAVRARQAGADGVVGADLAALETLGARTGSRLLKAERTRLPILVPGVDAVIDCVGSARTIDLGIHLLRAGGHLVLVGAAGRQQVDWSLVWNRELTIRGTVNSAPGTTEEIVDWLHDPAFAVDHLVTHVGTLDDWQAGFAAATAGPRVGAGKVTLRPDPTIPLVGSLTARTPSPVSGRRYGQARGHGRGTAS